MRGRRRGLRPPWSSTGTRAAVPDRASGDEATRVAALEAVYAGLDAAGERFARESGMACPPGCGACCRSPFVEASVLELIPMAARMFREGDAEAWLARTEDSGGKGPCVLYQATSPDGTLGRCTRYRERPALCRLFGFAGGRDKRGEVAFEVCRHLATVAPEVADGVRARVASGVQVPVFAEALARVASVDPHLALPLLPINEALRRALHWVGLRRGFEPEGPSGASPLRPAA